MNHSGDKSIKSQVTEYKKACNSARKRERLAAELRSNLKKRKIGPKSGKFGGDRSRVQGH